MADLLHWCVSCYREGEEDGAALLTPAELYLRLESVAGADAVKEPELVLVSPKRLSSLLYSIAQSTPTPPICLLEAWRICLCRKGTHCADSLHRV